MQRKRAVADLYSAWASHAASPACFVALYGIPDMGGASFDGGRWSFSPGICSSYRWPISADPMSGSIVASFVDTECDGSVNAEGIDIEMPDGSRRGERLEVHLIETPATHLPGFLREPDRGALSSCGRGAALVLGSRLIAAASICMVCPAFTYAPGVDFEFSGPGGSGAILSIVDNGL